MSRSLIVIAAIVAATLVGATAVLWATLGHHRIGRGLKRRFGPEYERLVTRHEGDTEAADRELGERLKQHGSVRERAPVFRFPGAVRRPMGRNPEAVRRLPA